MGAITWGISVFLSSLSLVKSLSESFCLSPAAPFQMFALNTLTETRRSTPAREKLLFAQSEGTDLQGLMVGLKAAVQRGCRTCCTVSGDGEDLYGMAKVSSVLQVFPCA